MSIERRAAADLGVDGIDALLDQALAARPKAHDFHVEKGATPSTCRDIGVTEG